MTTCSLVLALLLSVNSAADATTAAADALAKAVSNFEEALDTAQQSDFRVSFNDEARIAWSFFPGERAGIPLNALNTVQQALLLDVVRAGLSASGFEKVETIRSLDDVLGGSYDSAAYYLTLFGVPSGAAWGLRFEGHHVSLNWTVVEGRVVASTPQFLGANPAEVREGTLKGTRALSAEEDLARSLLKSLDDEQRSKCVLNDTAPPEILTGRDREAAIQENLGIAYGELNEAQQGLLLSLIDTFASVQRPELKEARLRGVQEAGLDALKFAWMGGSEPGEGHYYRIQGPSFIAEYDNTQGNANHIHTVWRDFKGDFGRDVLKEHYEAHADEDHPHEHRH